jgi:hypothetical protein
MTTTINDRLSRLCRVPYTNVKCPSCGAQPLGHQKHWREARGCSCPERKALARQVTSLLKAHFVVAERPCNGEAHDPRVGGMIDHCSVCAPRWGVVEYLTPIAALCPTPPPPPPPAPPEPVLSAREIRAKLGRVGCAECCGLGWAHFESDQHGFEIERCDNCAPDWFTDEHAAILHAEECGCDFVTTGKDPGEGAVALRTFHGTRAAAPAQSWMPQVIADSSGKWAGNALRFATMEEAEANVRNLSMRWMLVRETRVVTSTDEVNYQWDIERGLVPCRKGA